MSEWPSCSLEKGHQSDRINGILGRERGTEVAALEVTHHHLPAVPRRQRSHSKRGEKGDSGERGETRGRDWRGCPSLPVGPRRLVIVSALAGCSTTAGRGVRDRRRRKL